MADDMLTLARRNAAEAGATNVEFLKGHMEQMPLPDALVDVTISKCAPPSLRSRARLMRTAARASGVSRVPTPKA